MGGGLSPGTENYLINGSTTPSENTHREAGQRCGSKERIVKVCTLMSINQKVKDLPHDTYLHDKADFKTTAYSISNRGWTIQVTHDSLL